MTSRSYDVTATSNYRAVRAIAAGGFNYATTNMNYARGCDLNQSPKYVGLHDDDELRTAACSSASDRPAYATVTKHAVGIQFCQLSIIPMRLK